MIRHMLVRSSWGELKLQVAADKRWITFAGRSRIGCQNEEVEKRGNSRYRFDRTIGWPRMDGWRWDEGNLNEGEGT